ncbi:MAG: phosphate ABC transporter permease subunit PstC, partial [Anaerolineales bacterium]|nr:phosphate ABC transporter permease subunit PstC [Anaerolineales bacterium]
HKTPLQRAGLNLPGLNRRNQDRLAQGVMSALAIAASLLVLVIILALTLRAWPILEAHSLSELLFSQVWRPLQGVFGFYPFILGTFWVTAVGMVIAIPPSIFTAIYLAEYAHPKTRAMMTPIIDLLSGIPSVVYGVWGVLTVVPFVEKTLAPGLKRFLGPLPIFQSENPTGYGILAGGLVLAVMVFPIIIAVAENVISSVPQGLRDASLALGATRWQTIYHVVLKRARAGVLAAIVLGVSRAFGETMAVLMVVGNVPRVPHSIFDAAYPLTALIANNYGEMMSIPLYDAALLGAALILLLVVLVFNIGSRLVLGRLEMSD